MTLVSELELPGFDYTDGDMRGARFHEALRELRAQGWLAAGPYGYIVLEREACEFFLRSRSAIFPGMKIAEIFGVSEGPLYEEMQRNILHINGADHSRLRSLVNPALSPRAVERYRPLARELIAGLYEQSLARSLAQSPPRSVEQSLARSVARARTTEAGGMDTDGSPPGSPTDTGEPPHTTPMDAGEVVRCEFVEDFAKPYPSAMIAAVMGAPMTDAPRLHHWSKWIQRQFDAAAMAGEREGIERAVEEFYEYAGELVRRRRDDPGEDLISLLIAAEEEGERLSDVECVNLVLNVLIGGVDTTQSQLAHAVRLLAERPASWRALAEDPTLATRAVEEALRVEPITPFTARMTTEEVIFRDVVFPPETIVMVCAFTGNREEADDAAEWESFDLTAERDGGRVLTFGAGVHYCLGANLARLELQEALAYLPSRMPKLTLDGEPVYESIMGIYGLSSLPLRFTPPAS